MTGSAPASTGLYRHALSRITKPETVPQKVRLWK